MNSAIAMEVAFQGLHPVPPSFRVSLTACSPPPPRTQLPREFCQHPEDRCLPVGFGQLTGDSSGLAHPSRLLHDQGATPYPVLKKMTMRKMTARDGHSSGLQNRRPGSVSAFAKTRYTPSCTSLSLPPKKLEFIIRGLRPKLLNKMEFLLKTTKTHHLVYLFYLF